MSANALLKDKIRSGLSDLSLDHNDQQLDQCLQYLEMIERWNKVTNLTSVRDLDEMVSVHLMDSLSILPFVTGTSILDVGSGAGLPGIPLAMFCPDKDFILLDSNGKKTRFMTQATIELSLKNVTVVHQRIEQFDQQVEQVVCRAFTALDQFATLCGGLLKQGGSLLAMKGPSESEESVDGWKIVSHPLRVPQLSGERYLLEMTQ